jgi:2',3'-cyclic-nucleotide 2'-phosphodiesterase (5'-nucleotidase family)
MRKCDFFLVFVAPLFAISCNTAYKAETVKYSSYRIQQPASSNTLTSVIKPYSDSVNKLMHIVIGYNETMLEKKKQPSTLGYFIADAYLDMARKKVDQHVDAAFMNSGGIRVNDLPEGAITQGKIYELMPFDNLMVVLKMKGSQLKQYLDTLAATEAVIESGITMQIENKAAQKIIVGGKPLDPNAEYTIVHSDYVAINTNLLKNIPRKTNGYLLRDAIIDYVELNNSQGKKIKVLNTDRVIYVN